MVKSIKMWEEYGIVKAEIVWFSEITNNNVTMKLNRKDDGMWEIWDIKIIYPVPLHKFGFTFEGIEERLEAIYESVWHSNKKDEKILA